MTSSPVWASWSDPDIGKDDIGEFIILPEVRNQPFSLSSSKDRELLQK